MAVTQLDTNNELLSAALGYAELGIRVLPLRARTKLPATEHGVNDATINPSQIIAWWTRWPTANVGLACGETRDGWQLVVVDLDRHNPAEDGIEAWDELVRLNGGERTTGPESLTPSGGLHILLRLDTEVRNSAARNFPAGIDIRGEGGYIVAPPSISASGIPYSWDGFAGPDEEPIVAPPAWLLERLTRTAKPRERRVGPPCEDRNRPGDWKAARWDWATELTKVGATYIEDRDDRDGNTYELWARPGKHPRDGASATLGYGGSNVLKVFTSSWPGLTQDETYTPFGFYAAVYHGGDQAAAASAIRTEMQLADAAMFKATERPSLRVVADDGEPGPERINWPHTDLGNARRLVHEHGVDLRYAPQLGAWYVWDDTRWREDETGAINRRAKAVVDGMLSDAQAATDSVERKELQKHWLRSQSVNRIEAMITVARTEPNVPVLIDELDGDPWLLNVVNGTINLATGEFGPHDRAHLITKTTPVTYDPVAGCPTWTAFVHWAMQGDEQLIEFVQRAVGYSLTGSIAEQVLFFLHGGGENGKSTFINVLQALTGDYSMAAPRDLLLAADHEAHSTGLTDLVGRRLVVAQELDEGRRFDEATVKQLTGGDSVRARRMRQDFFQFDIHAKFWLAANHKPAIRGTDHAIWRRIRLIPFTATIAPGQRDERLGEKLRAELPGILNWALEGLRRWRSDGLGQAAAIAEATAAYRHDQDHIGRFLDECCIVHADAYISARELRETYEKWCQESGDHPWSARALGGRLTERGFGRVRRGANGSYVWLGVGLPSEWSHMSNHGSDGSAEALTERSTVQSEPISRSPHARDVFPELTGAEFSKPQTVQEPLAATQSDREWL